MEGQNDPLGIAIGIGMLVSVIALVVAAVVACIRKTIQTHKRNVCSCQTCQLYDHLEYEESEGQI